MNDLANKKCISCEAGGMDPFTQAEANKLHVEIPDWKLADDAKKISREFTFKDFVQAMSFVDALADIAEGEGHHPDIYIFYNKVKLELSTHATLGLSENDFIVAAKIDGLFARMQS